MTKYEYVWLDGYEPEANLRSKVKVTDGEPPAWSFDGSSTLQAEGGSSDCILLPVQQYENPTNGVPWFCVKLKLASMNPTHQILEQQQLLLLLTNGGSDLNKNIS